MVLALASDHNSTNYKISPLGHNLILDGFLPNSLRNKTRLAALFKYFCST